jgi:hypothetical protein
VEKRAKTGVVGKILAICAAIESSPMIQSMSNPRSASSEASRCEGDCAECRSDCAAAPSPAKREAVGDKVDAVKVFSTAGIFP